MVVDVLVVEEEEKEEEYEGVVEQCEDPSRAVDSKEASSSIHSLIIAL